MGLYRLRVLGGLHLEGPDGAVLGLVSRRRPLALLAVLAVHLDEGLSRDRAAALLWGDSDDQHALHSLSDNLYTIRAALGADAVLGSAAELKLNPAVVESDVAAFAAALRRGDRAAAVAAWGGLLLEGFHVPGAAAFEEWLGLERRCLVGKLASALEGLAADARKAGDHAAAAGWLRRLAELDPYNSRIAMDLARALAASRDPGNALQVLRDHAEELRRELGAAPDAEVARLMGELRLGPNAVGTDAGTRPFRSVFDSGAGDGRGSGEGAGAALAALPAAASPADAGGAAGPKARRRGVARAVGVAVALVAVTAGLLYFGRSRQAGPALQVGHAVRLTIGPELALDPALSPDGHWVAYITAGPLQAGRLVIQPVAGGDAVRVLRYSTGWEALPAWSPDGQRLAFLFGSGRGPHAAVIPAFGGAMRVLGLCAPISVSWSPDGRRVLCPSTELDGTLLRYEADGNGQDSLVVPAFADTSGAGPYTCAWGAAGHVACAGGNVWFRFNPPFRGNLAASMIRILPSGGTAAFALDTSRALNESPVWSGDGRHLYFVSDRTGQRDIWRYRIGANGRTIGEPVRVTVGSNAMSVSVTPDERLLAYTSFRAPEASLWSAPLRRGGSIGRAGAMRLTPGSQAIDPTSPRLSADGRWITYLSDARGNNDLYRVPAAGGEVEALTDTPEDEGTGDVSPGGDEMAYSLQRDGSREVFVRALGAGGLTRLTRTRRAEERLVAWSPDGQALSAYDCCVSSDITEATRVIEREGPRGWGEARLAVPDAYCRWLRTAWLLCPRGDSVQAVSIHGEPTRTVYVRRPGEPPAREWRLTIPGDDGRSFLLVDSAGVIWRIATPGARPMRFARIADPDIVRGLFDIRAGRLYYRLVDRAASADIWVAYLQPVP